MAKKYYRWKDENCNGIDPEWVQMTGTQFKAFKDNNKSRKFIVIGDEALDDDILFMEATPEQYKIWKHNNNRAEYCKRLEYQVGVRFVSFDEEIDETEELTRHEVIADETVDIEQDTFRSEMFLKLKAALKTLTQEEYDLIFAMFLSDIPITERAYAAKLGISGVAVHKRKTAILNKLKNFFDF